MGELLFNVTKGTRRILLIYKVFFQAKWMKRGGIVLIKQILLRTYYVPGSVLMLIGRMNIADKNLYFHGHS